MFSNRPPIPYSVLVIEDEIAIAENLALALESEGFVADMAFNGRSALKKLKDERPDLVILDVGLPGIDGHKVMASMREELKLSTPVLMLTARSTLEDKLQGFSCGADDYLTKPFVLDEVLMRTKALIRRSKQLADTSFALSHGPLRYVVADQCVTVNALEVKLPKKALMLLEVLMRYGGRVVPRQLLEEYLWQGEPPSADALRSQVHLLRKYLLAHDYDGIETVHNQGWRLCASPASPLT